MQVILLQVNETYTSAYRKIRFGAGFPDSTLSLSSSFTFVTLTCTSFLTSCSPLSTTVSPIIDDCHSLIQYEWNPREVMDFGLSVTYELPWEANGHMGPPILPTQQTHFSLCAGPTDKWLDPRPLRWTSEAVALFDCRVAQLLCLNEVRACVRRPAMAY